MPEKNVPDKEPKSPAVQFYFRDFLADTAHLTNEEVGIYIRWLGYAWVGIDGCEQGQLPDDDEFLRRLVHIGRKKMASSGVRTKRLFRAAKNRKIESKRLSEERENQRKRRLQAVEAGKKGAELRWGSDSDRYGDPMVPAIAEGMAKNGSASATPSASSSASLKKPQTPEEGVDPPGLDHLKKTYLRTTKGPDRAEYLDRSLRAALIRKVPATKLETIMMDQRYAGYRIHDIVKVAEGPVKGVEAHAEQEPNPGPAPKSSDQVRKEQEEAVRQMEEWIAKKAAGGGKGRA